MHFYNPVYGGGGGGSINEWDAIESLVRVNDANFAVTDDATNQAALIPGRPIRFRSTGGVYRYGIVEEYVAGAVRFSGAPMTAADDDELEWSPLNKVITQQIMIPGRWADGISAALLNDDLLLPGGLRWLHTVGYLVRIGAIDMVDDSGADQPRVNVAINAGIVCTANANAGLAVIDTAYVTSGVEINVATYEINTLDYFEVTTDANGTNNDSTDLLLELVFILE
jgi:hypothetical protein